MCDSVPSLTAGPSAQHGGPPSQQQNGWKWTCSVSEAYKALPSCALSAEQAQELVSAALAATAAAAHTPAPHQELLTDPAALQRLQQALSGVLQLTLLVCCQPSYHVALAPCGAWASASSRLQDATKQLLGHLTQLVAATSSEEGWQALLPCVTTAAELLVDLAITAAALVAAYPCGRAAAPPPAPLPPKDMASFVLLNLGWASLTRLLSQLRPGAAAQVLPPAALQAALGAALTHGRTAMVHWAASPTKPQQTVVKFWQQAVAKLAAAAPEAAAAGGPWHELVATVRWMVEQIDTREEPISQEVSGALLPRLLPSLCRALDAAAAAGDAQLQECLATLVAAPHQQQRQQQEPEAMEVCGSLSSQLQQGLVIAGEILVAAPAAGCEAATTVAHHLLPWALQLVSQQLAACSLAAVDSSTNQPDAATTAADDPAGPLLVAAAAVLLSLGAAEDLAPAAEAAGASLMSAVLSPHPLTRHLGAQLSAALLAARPPAAQVATLDDAWELVGDVAAAEGAAAPGWAACSASHQLLPTLALWLQVLPPEAATAWLVARAPGASSATDASSCAVTAALCCLLELLGPGAAACCVAELAGHADALAAALQQTLSLMGPGVCPSDAALEAAAGHQLGWQLEAAAACLAALHLGQACAGATEGRLWEAALAALQRGLGGCTAPSQPTEPAPGFCLPALHLLAQAGATMAASLGPGEQQAAADLLLAAVQHPPLQVAAARVAAHLTRLEQPPQSLFHALLGSPAWQVRAAGREALVAVSRAGGGPGFLALLPPCARTGAGAAHPAFVSAFSAALKQEPDAQAAATVAEAGPGRLQSLQHQLMAAVAQPLGSPGLGPLPGWVAAVASSPLQPGGACRAAVGAGVAPGGAGGAEAAATHLKELAAAARAQLAAVSQALDNAEAAVAGFVTGVQDVRSEWGGASSATSASSLRGLAAPLVGDLTSLGSRLRTLTSRLSS